MRSFCFLLVLISQFLFSQNSDSKKADQLHSIGNYKEEIVVRQDLISTIEDETSDLYKTQLYKIRLAEYYSSSHPEEKKKKISEAEEIINSLEKVEPFDKIKIGMEHFEVMGNFGDERGIDKGGQILRYTLNLPKSEQRDQWLAHIYIHLGRAHLYYKNLDKAVDFFEKSLELNKELYGEKSIETANSYDQLSITHSYTNNYPAVLDYSDKSLEIYEKIQPESPIVLFEQYSKTFQVNKYYGDFKRVEELYLKIQEYFEVNKDNHEFIHAVHPDFKYLNPAYTIYYFVQIQYANAKNDPLLAEKAFLDFQKTLPKENIKYSRYEQNQINSILLETGSTFHNYKKNEKINNYSKAKKYYLEVTKFSKTQEFPFGELQSYMMLSILGVDYEKWGDVVKYSNIALEHPEIHVFNQTQTLKHNLGLAYVETEEYDKAVEVFDEEYLFYKDDSGVDYYTLTNLTESGDAFINIFKKINKNIYLEKAYRNFHLASQIFSQLYRGGEFSKRLYSFSNKINEGLLYTSIRLNSNQTEVLSRIEINNSDYLWSSFVKNRKEKLDKNTLKLQTQIDSLQNLKEYLSLKIARTETDSEINRLNSDWKSANDKYLSVKAELKKLDNSFYEFSRTDFDLTEIQDNISDSEQIIKYVITNSSVYAFLIDKDSIELIDLVINSNELEDIVLSFINSLKEIKPDYDKNAKRLYYVLIQPFNLENKRNLTIIPDQFLAYLPFEILMNPSDEFLLKDHVINYGYSLKLIKLQKALKGNFNNRLAAFSPDYDMDFAKKSTDEDVLVLVRSGHYKLAGAIEETKLISSIFNGDIYTGNDATKLNFQKNSSDYDIFHLAMHAIVNEEDPEKSSLIFNNNERLYLEELYEMKIPANLAVLSACNTGFGEIQEGEGVQSLSRAFTYAGVKSTVMSLWAVPDQQTSLIMTEFYNRLKSGNSKSEALRLAKINYLETTDEDELKHPYYWASFLINGDVEALPKNNMTKWYVIIGVFSLFVILMVLSGRKKYR